MGRRILILITSSYPYDTEEPFLESEVIHYDIFDQVIIFPLSKSIHRCIRELPENCQVIDIGNQYNFNCLDYFNGSIIREILSLKMSKKINDNSISKMFEFYSQSINYAESIKHELLNKGINRNDDIIIYSYWLYTHALTAILLKKYFKNSFTVSRCHGYDVFEERHENLYIPFRKMILSEIDVVMPIAKMQKEYIKCKYKKVKAKIIVSYLGTKREIPIKDLAQLKVNNKNTLRIISCSSIIAIKRVEKIIEVLKSINDIPIEWTHIGDGDMMDYIKRMAKEQLGSNIECNFKGHISNQDVKLNYNNNQYHLFIHLSETEGLPVSFMEAMSYGIPIISTNVGGVSEIVKHNVNGFLVDKDFDIKDVKNLINYFYYMPLDAYNLFRYKSYKTWKNKFNSDNNYKKFLDKLMFFKEKNNKGRKDANR